MYIFYSEDVPVLHKNQDEDPHIFESKENSQSASSNNDLKLNTHFKLNSFEINENRNFAIHGNNPASSGVKLSGTNTQNNGSEKTIGKLNAYFYCIVILNKKFFFIIQMKTSTTVKTITIK